MATRRVQAPDGTVWRVRRRWTPRYEGRGLRARSEAWRRRRRGGDAADGADAAGCAFDLLSFEGLGGAAVVLGLVALLAVMVLFGIPLVLALVDLVVVAVVVVGGAVARLLFRRPWVVEATSETGQRIVRHAVGWRRSAEARDEIAAEIAHGRGQVGSPP